MSYCRWSSDQFGSDVYVYEAVDGGYTCHVAARRHASDEPKPPAFEGELTPESVPQYMAAHHALMEWCEGAHMEPIGLPHDGDSINLDTPGEMADKLVELKEEGYHVPQYAIDTLREEQEELKSETL